jgi:hypothetical protein
VRVCNEIPKPKIVLVAGVGHALSFQDVIVEAQDYDLVRYVATQESLSLKDADLRFLRTDMAESVMTVPCQKDAISNGIHEVLSNYFSRASKRTNLPYGKPNATSELVSILEKIAKRAVA